MSKRLSPRISLIIIAAMFLLPLLLAWFMYTGAIEYKPGTTRNLGQLVEPPVPMSWSSISILGLTGDGPQPAEQDLAEHWVVLKSVPSDCAGACVDEVTELRQVHRAAGRNMSRIRIALLLPEVTPASAATRLQEIYPEFRLITSQDGTLEDAMARSANGAAATYLIDPLGNIMMVYKTGADPNDLKKDLKRLLTWSKLDE